MAAAGGSAVHQELREGRRVGGGVGTGEAFDDAVRRSGDGSRIIATVDGSFGIPSSIVVVLEGGEEADGGPRAAASGGGDGAAHVERVGPVLAADGPEAPVAQRREGNRAPGGVTVTLERFEGCDDFAEDEGEEGLLDEVLVDGDRTGGGRGIRGGFGGASRGCVGPCGSARLLANG